MQMPITPPFNKLSKIKKHQMIEEYGFVADTKLTLNQNINKQIIQLSIQELSTPSKSLANHNLSYNTLLPK